MKPITLIFFILFVRCVAAEPEPEPNHPSVKSGWWFEYAGAWYTNSQPTDAQLDASPAWNISMGVPPVSVAEAHKLALQWIKAEIDPNFVGTAYTMVLNYQVSQNEKRGYWQIVFTEEKEAEVKMKELRNADAARAILFKPASLHMFVFFNKTVVGPKKK